MMERRSLLKTLAAAGVVVSVQGSTLLAAPAKVRVTLVRWPYT